VGPDAADVDGADVELVPIQTPALAAEITPRIRALESLLMAGLVWGPLLLIFTVPDVQAEIFGVVGVLPAAVDVDSTDLPLVPIKRPVWLLRVHLGSDRLHPC